MFNGVAWRGRRARCEATLAGGARQRVTFFACAKKVTKESTPRCRRNPGRKALVRAAKKLASLKQLSLAFGFPGQVPSARRRQRGEEHPMASGVTLRKRLPQAIPLAEGRFSPLLTPPTGRRRRGGSRRACLSPAGASLRAALGAGDRSGISAEAGRAFFGYFLCMSKESNALPGAPGLPPCAKAHP